MSHSVERDMEGFFDDEDLGKAAAARLLYVASRSWRKKYGEDSVSTQAPKAEEVLQEASRFSEKARELLLQKGYVILTLKGKSMASLRDSGNKFFRPLDGSYPDLETLPSRSSEVAFNPKQPFLPNSNKKTLEEQMEMVSDFSKRFSEDIPGVKVIIGEAPDYAELVFTHLKATGNKENLFGKDYDYPFALTQTESASCIVSVGSFGYDGLRYNRNLPRDPGNVCFVFPLVVPVSNVA